MSGVDFAQQKFGGAGDQSNESAVEQAKDEQISDFIRYVVMLCRHSHCILSKLDTHRVFDNFFGRVPADETNRDKYKSTTGSDFPIKDKENKFG